MDEISESDSETPGEPPDILGSIMADAGEITALMVRQLSKVSVLRDDALAAAGGRVGREIVLRSVRLELASALRVTEYAAGKMLSLADSLFHRYPAVLASVERAAITVDHAEILTSGADGASPEHREEILLLGLVLAEAEPVGVFRRKLATLIETIQTDTLTPRHAAALEVRRVVVEADADGMAWMHWFGPAVEARAIHTRVTAMATVLRAADGEERTLDQLRSDVFADLLIEGEVAAHRGEVRGIHASLTVTVPALALLSDDPEVLADCDPAVVEGLGPIPLERARELAGGAEVWNRVLTHPEKGTVLSVGRTRYRPPPSLVRLVKWRADRCMAPGCNMPAARCQIDHTIAWEHGGSTSLVNLAPLCQGRHTIKHHGGWSVRQVDGSGGALEWTSPLGRRYVKEPERRVPVFTASAPEVDKTPAPF